MCEPGGSDNVSSPQIFFFVLGLVLGLVGCAGKTAHDEALAAKRAVEFAEAVFVQTTLRKAAAYFPLVQGGMFQSRNSKKLSLACIQKVTRRA
jgi:hypothetical protein